MSIHPDILKQHAEAARLIRQSLSEHDDEELTLDMIEGETDLFPILDRIMSSIADDETMIEAIKAREAELKARKDRIGKRVETMRTLVERAMLTADVSKIERPEYTLSMRKGTAQLSVYDEDQIPADYFKVPAPSLDRTALKNALKDGTDVPGASLTNGQPSLSVRRK